MVKTKVNKKSTSNHKICLIYCVLKHSSVFTLSDSNSLTKQLCVCFQYFQKTAATQNYAITYYIVLDRKIRDTVFYISMWGPAPQAFRQYTYLGVLQTDWEKSKNIFVVYLYVKSEMKNPYYSIDEIVIYETAAISDTAKYTAETAGVIYCIGCTL